MSKKNKNCMHCGNQKNRRYPNNSYYCLKCTWAIRHPLADIAFDCVKAAIRNGLMPRAKDLKCIDCGSMATEYDHRNYTRPIEVDPVCHGCNMRRGPAFPYVGELDLCLDDYRLKAVKS